MSCEVEDNCLAKGVYCWICRYADKSNPENCYTPIDKNVKHPEALKAAKERKDKEKQDKKIAAANKNKERSRIVRDSAKVEDRVRKTLNSGRINRDGDLKTSDLAIDVKYQSTTINPVINAEEFRKIQNDAERGGKRHGVLVIVGKDGVEYVVMSQELFKEGFVE